MSRTSKILSISMPPSLLKDIQSIRKQKRMTKSELIREAIRDYLEGEKIILNTEKKRKK